MSIENKKEIIENLNGIVELKKLENVFNPDIYKMLYHMKSDYNGFKNYAHQLSKVDFEKWLIDMNNSANNINLPKGYVPQIIYFIYFENIPVGIIKLRYKLNESLRNLGGHISIAIDQKYVGKGIGTIAFKKAIDILENEYNVKEIFITIRKDNISSRRMAEKNSFKLEKITDNICRYWKRI